MRPNPNANAKVGLGDDPHKGYDLIQPRRVTKMAEYDDTDKKAKPLKSPVTVSYKSSSKNAICKTGGKDTNRKNAMFQHNEHQISPLEALINGRNTGKHKSKKAKHTVDPYMVRLAKMQAAKQAK